MTGARGCLLLLVAVLAFGATGGARAQEAADPAPTAPAAAAAAGAEDPAEPAKAQTGAAAEHPTVDPPAVAPAQEKGGKDGPASPPATSARTGASRRSGSGTPPPTRPTTKDDVVPTEAGTPPPEDTPRDIDGGSPAIPPPTCPEASPDPRLDVLSWLPWMGMVGLLVNTGAVVALWRTRAAVPPTGDDSTALADLARLDQAHARLAEGVERLRTELGGKITVVGRTIEKHTDAIDRLRIALTPPPPADEPSDEEGPGEIPFNTTYTVPPWPPPAPEQGPPRSLQDVVTDACVALGVNFHTVDAAAQLFSRVRASERFALCAAAKEGSRWRLNPRGETKPDAFVVHDGGTGYLLPNVPRYGSVEGDYSLAGRAGGLPNAAIVRVEMIAVGSVEGEFYRTVHPGKVSEGG